MNLDDLLTRWTVRLAFAAYALGVGTLLAGRRAPRQMRLARVAWTFGCAAYLAHVACAFGFYHHWSHATAYEHTAKRTEELLGFVWGGGIYFNYVFTACWIGDAIWWWRRVDAYTSRSPLVNRSIHAFMAFMFFQATVVFGDGPIRWVGVVVFAALAILWVRATRLGKTY